MNEGPTARRVSPARIREQGEKGRGEDGEGWIDERRKEGKQDFFFSVAGEKAPPETLADSPVRGSHGRQP